MAEDRKANYQSVGELAAEGIKRAVIAIGVFDGVHCGHRKLLAELLRMSNKLQASPVVMTFSPHPRALLNSVPPVLLYPPEEKLRFLYQAGAERVVTLNFTKALSQLSPAEFLQQKVFCGPVEVLGICVGKHWRFGAKGAGNSNYLEEDAKQHQYLFSAVDELCLEDGTTVSSTLIRFKIGTGDLVSAEKMLGRRYSLFGEVVHGYEIARNKLAAPTANLKISDGVLPAFGVYAARVKLDHGTEMFPAAVNIGNSPTFRREYGEIEPRIEVHLLGNFNGDLYGRFMEVELAGHVRAEKKFDSPEELKQQINRDIQTIYTMLERN